MVVVLVDCPLLLLIADYDARCLPWYVVLQVLLLIVGDALLPRLPLWF